MNLLLFKEFMYYYSVVDGNILKEIETEKSKDGLYKSLINIYNYKNLLFFLF